MKISIEEKNIHFTLFSVPWNTTDLKTGLGIYTSRGRASVKVPFLDPLGLDLDCGRSWLILPYSVLRDFSIQWLEFFIALYFCNRWLQFSSDVSLNTGVLVVWLFHITDL
jgi:hypothetical protein